MATQKQIDHLDWLLKHIRENALDLIDREQLQMERLIPVMSTKAVDYLQSGRLQHLIDMGAAALAHRVKAVPDE